MTQKAKQSKEIVIVNSRQLECFKMRFKGHTYEQMEASTGYKARTLELYFYKGGRWHDSYIAWRTWQVESIKDQMDNMFVAQAIQANQQVVNLTQGRVFITTTGPDGKEILVPISVKPDVILNAAKDILDRAGFKPVEKVESKTPEDIAEKMMEFFEGKEKEKIPAKKGKAK